MAAPGGCSPGSTRKWTFSESLDAFVAVIEQDFYVDRDRVRQSIEQEDSSNIIELNLALEVGIFVRRTTPLSVSELKRAQEVTTEAGHRTARTPRQRREPDRKARAENIGAVESPWISRIFATLPPAMLPERVDI